MGRAGPAQLTGPDSAQKGLGRSRPSRDWADLGPTKSSIFRLGRTWPRQQGWARTSLAHKTQGWARTSLAQRRKNQQCRARISLARQHNIRGGIIFPLPSCMQNAVRSACRGKTTKVQTIRGEKSYLAWRRWCVAGLAALLAVLRWRLVAVLWLTGGGSKQ